MRVWYKNVDGVHAFYINGLLRSLTLALVSIFVPVFVYTEGLSHGWSTTQAILGVVAYYIIQRLIVLILAIPASKIIEHIGFRRSIAISIVLLILHMGSLVLAKDQPWMILAATVFMGLNIPMYWIARDSALSQDAVGKEIGRELAGIGALEQIAALSGPFVAGVIIEKWGFATLFSLALVLLFVSLIPLWWMPHHVHRNGVSLSGFKIWITSRRYFHQALSQIGTSMQDYGLAVLWPLTLFFGGMKVGVLGIIFSGVQIVRVGLQYTVGVWFDRLRKKGGLADETVFAIATIGSAIMWILRTFIVSVWQVVAVDSLSQGFNTVYYGFQANYAHLGGKRMGSIAFWVYSEMVYSIACIAIFALMGVGVYFDVWKQLTFLTIAFWIVISVVQARESNMK